MQQPDLQINSPQFTLDADATRQMAYYTAKIEDIFRDIYSNLRSVKIVTSAPSMTELQEYLNISDVVIEHNATAANRKIWYKYQGTVYSIQGS